MKKSGIFLLLLILIFILPTKAQNRWIEDSQMKFKISVPENYQTNQFWEGTDKIHAFVSPDQNVAVMVRSIPVAANATVELVIQAFSQNIIKGAQQLVIQAYTLNGLNGKMAAYKWRYNNISVVIGAFYTIQSGIAHVVWTMVPENLFAKRSAESDTITNSFTVLSVSSTVAQSSGVSGNTKGTGNQQSQSQSGNQGWQQQSQDRPVPVNIQITDASVGIDVDADYQIKNPQNMLSSTTGRINLVFGYSGNAKGKTFVTKWYSNTHNALVKEFSYFPPDAVSGRGHAYIENPGRSWPEGNYRVEIWLDEKVLHELTFSIGAATSKVQQPGVQTENSYSSLVSDDACLEHLIPAGAKVRKSEQGQTIWNIPLGASGKNLTMVIQNILKQGKNFTGFINEQIVSIKNNGALVRFQEFGNVNGLNCCKYLYEYNGTVFIYTAVDGPQTFYLLGFVGGADNEGELKKYYQAVHPSFKKASCAGQPVQQPGASSGQITKSQGAGAVKQIVLDNQNNGYDFVSGKVRDGHQSPDPDVLNEPWCTALPALCGNWAKTGKSKMEDVVSAPSSGYISDGKSYADCQECPVNEVLVFKLKDGSYGKLMIIKDEKTQTNNGCQHQITCLIQYPAF